MAKNVVDQVPGVLVVYDDGSTDRVTLGVLVPCNAEFVEGIASKDVVISSVTGLWVRIFLPQSVVNSPKTPVVLHFHGGGMCLGSPAELAFHEYCRRMALRSQYIWVSVGYRLSPEHRLPTQHEDCFEAFRWLHKQFSYEDIQKEPWIVEHADASNVFCTGESAGATIQHYVALRRSKTDWSPVKVRGLVLVDIGNLKDPLPKMKPSLDVSLSEEMLLAFVRLSLPHGAKFPDPVMCVLHPSNPSLSDTPFPPVLVTAADRDILHDGCVEYFHALKEAGKDVELLVAEGEGHCFHLQRPESEAAQFRENKIVEFMQKRVQSPESVKE